MKATCTDCGNAYDEASRALATNPVHRCDPCFALALDALTPHQVQRDLSDNYDLATDYISRALLFIVPGTPEYAAVETALEKLSERLASLSEETHSAAAAR